MWEAGGGASVQLESCAFEQPTKRTKRSNSGAEQEDVLRCLPWFGLLYIKFTL